MEIFFLVLMCLPLVLLVLFFSTFFTVGQQSMVIIERFGRFNRIARAGLNFKLPFIESKAGTVSLRIRQLDVRAETKTKDNVFVNVIVSIQYFIIPERVYDAFYKLVDPTQQINSYVFDVVRARVPKITLDNLFENKDEIAFAVKAELNETMVNFGFEILNSLVTDIEPDTKVKTAMNEINAAERLKVAATEKGEADKIMKVKAAEAEAEAKALQGKGIADQRKAIIDGLKDSVGDFQKNIAGSTAQEVMNLVLLTQYFDTLKDIGSNSNTILVPHGPGAVEDIATQLRNAMITADAVDRANSRFSKN
ncbi:MAG: SPFH domain-containing protein [Candidatus Dojkabacteria bacterium]|uniref:Modulator of FtsH protease HflK n=2 Tax=Candidatus Dojkabacteria TaxID=74243 RepID=A0A136KE45_9BACT|nr:MAG: Modulator of FtsH protease HflK [candidate division WS6 bacterium OLB21]MBW7953481.1 SPFH domain-containing protein [Candidatus Dojkabacteria bacterium]WKZ28186.1 MAG: SPFH domain-containing protein [Candidatus Dojkabacteria bacterium]